MKLNIETKYNIGDKFWILSHDNRGNPKVKEVEITSIRVTGEIPHGMSGWPFSEEKMRNLPEYSIKIEYSTNHFYSFDENEKLYTTKEELLASL